MWCETPTTYVFRPNALMFKSTRVFRQPARKWALSSIFTPAVVVALNFVHSSHSSKGLELLQLKLGQTEKEKKKEH